MSTPPDEFPVTVSCLLNRSETNIDPETSKLIQRIREAQERCNNARRPPQRAYPLAVFSGADVFEFEKLKTDIRSNTFSINFQTTTDDEMLTNEQTLSLPQSEFDAFTTWILQNINVPDLTVPEDHTFVALPFGFTLVAVLVDLFKGVTDSFPEGPAGDDLFEQLLEVTTPKAQPLFEKLQDKLPSLVQHFLKNDRSRLNTLLDRQGFFEAALTELVVDPDVFDKEQRVDLAKELLRRGYNDQLVEVLDEAKGKYFVRGFITQLSRDRAPDVLSLEDVLENENALRHFDNFHLYRTFVPDFLDTIQFQTDHPLLTQVPDALLIQELQECCKKEGLNWAEFDVFLGKFDFTEFCDPTTFGHIMAAKELGAKLWYFIPDNHDKYELEETIEKLKEECDCLQQQKYELTTFLFLEGKKQT